MSAPLVVGVGLGIYADVQQTVSHTKTTLRTLASAMVTNTGVQIASARQMLERIAARPLVRQVDGEHCDEALKELPGLVPGYTNFLYVDLQGRVICSALPVPSGKVADAGSQPSFQRFLRDPRFTVGEPMADPITGQWASALSAPIWNEHKALVGAVRLPLDLKQLDPKIPAQVLPDGTRYVFFAQDGTLVWRNVDPGALIGTRRDDETARRIVALRDGELEGPGSDGASRYFSVVHMPETGWTAYVSVPMSAVYTAAIERAAVAAAVALATIVALLGLTVFIARRIARPVAALESAAHAVHAGNLGVRATVDGPREIAAVALEFNAMIEAQQGALEQLRIAATAFESQQGLNIMNADKVILQVNQAFTVITGYTADECVGRKPQFMRSDRHAEDFFEQVWRAAQRSGGWQGEIWTRRKNGEVFPDWVTLTAVRSKLGVITHYVGSHVDITDRKLAQDRITQLAFYDPLTALPNRRLLLDRLHRAVAAGKRSRLYGALLLIDLDDFKTLNDTLGHHQGDLLMQHVAQRLGSCTREGDTVARLGGDEFVVMLESLSESSEGAAAEAEAAAERIAASLGQPYLLAGQEHRSTASIGATLFSGQQATADEALKQAELAMYQAKSAGRNTLRFFDPEMQARVSHRAALEADLREAVKLEQFVVHYQPQVMGEGRMFGAEALVRWQHPRRGMVSPAEFIPLAEESGLILPLGLWVLQTACAQLASWAGDQTTEPLCIAVNISALQLQQDDFVETIQAVLRQTGANPQRLKLELTESLLVADIEGIIAKMRALKAIGVGFSLDDFGTGFSSLTYLKRLPLDQLKIDQSFVTDILTDVNDAAIARIVIALAESLGLTVIAEGVETEAQREFLARERCAAYQGFLFSRPLPVAEFEGLLQLA